MPKPLCPLVCPPAYIGRTRVSPERHARSYERTDDAHQQVFADTHTHTSPLARTLGTHLKCKTSFPRTYIVLYMYARTHPLTPEPICVSVCARACVYAHVWGNRECMIEQPAHLYLSEEYYSLISFREHNRKSSWNCASLVTSRLVSGSSISQSYTTTQTIRALDSVKSCAQTYRTKPTDRPESARDNLVLT